MKLIREDTVKTNSGKWTNRGKEGTHGTFSTKKAADRQRKAMFANGFKESLSDEWENIRGQILNFPNGEYLYVDVQDDKLIAGSATNTGIIAEYSIDIDDDFGVDWNLQNLYDAIVEERPELLDEGFTKPSKTSTPIW